MPEPPALPALLPALLLAAHGTRSAAGSATTAALAATVAAARHDVAVSLCFLDVAAPSLAEALSRATGPVVVVPLLLSSGFHVLEDIPAVVADRAQVRVARHLGPDPLVVDALVDRLAAARGGVGFATTVLAGAASSNPAAAGELAQAAAQLATRLGRPVAVLSLAEDVRARLAAFPAPVAVATYLLAEGQFVDTLRAAAAGAGSLHVADPIGAHPALAALVLARYDEVLAGSTPP